MEKLVVTASLTLPIADSTTANMHASASAMMIGPDTTPPGRSIDGRKGSRSAARPRSIASACMPISYAHGRSSRMIASKSAMLISARTNASPRLIGHESRRLDDDVNADRSDRANHLASGPPPLDICNARRARRQRKAKTMDATTEERKSVTQAPLLLRRDAGTVATLTLNRQDKFNALSVSLLAALQEQLAAIGRDPSIRVVVLAGAGKAFCTGHDLHEMRENPGRQATQALFRQCAEVMLTMTRIPQPV